MANDVVATTSTPLGENRCYPDALLGGTDLISQSRIPHLTFIERAALSPPRSSVMITVHKLSSPVSPNNRIYTSLD